MADENTGGVRMTAIVDMVNEMSYKGQILARTNKLESGIMDSGTVGFAVGLLISLFMVIPFIMGVL
ncbi:MAG: tetrahydromethanopterin S-methyltransferase subunit F [Methanomicrobiales archaeon]|jgi:tetrahydromethanopterin S-methyltransferase subunit F|nr:tetrahydromethanopterin S-methyltransferase subunit F [Methanomicrobiales archaeon]